MKTTLMFLALSLVALSGCAVTPAVRGTANYDTATGGVDVGVEFEIKKVFVTQADGTLIEKEVLVKRVKK